MDNMSIAVNKMLDAFGLRIKKTKFNAVVFGVNDEKNGFVRSFVDKCGRTLSWYNDNPTYYYINSQIGNGIPCGSWSVFKNDDAATFSLFTEKMKKFSFDFHQNAKIVNPFYGCRSIEEVLIKCDLFRNVCIERET